MNTTRVLLVSCCVAALSCAPARGNFNNNTDSSDSGSQTQTDAGPMGPHCASNADCASIKNLQICDSVTHECVQCLLPTQCPTNEMCANDHTCAGTMNCTSNSQCDSISMCASNGTCVVTPGLCETSMDCVTQVNKVCDTAEAACVQCVTDSDCGSGNVATCSTTTNTCQVAQGRCLHNTDCNSTPNTPVCDTTTNFCVQCQANTDCTDSAMSVCNPSGVCVECQQNSDCPSEQCNGNTCLPLGQCSTQANCVNVPNKPQCDSSQTCVQCTQTSQCQSGQTCTSNSCVQTSACSQTCSGSTAVCDQSTGQCVQCVLSTDCGSGQTCTSNMCATETCTNRNCNGVNCNTSGETCNTSTCTCQTGSTDGGSNPPFYCNPNCTTDSDCGGTDNDAGISSNGNYCLCEDTSCLTTFCGTKCTGAANCPSTATCQSIQNSAGTIIGKNCVPTSGTCP